MKRNDIVILRGLYSDGIGKLISQSDFSCFQFYKTQSNLLFRSLRRICDKLGFSFSSIWYDKKVLSSNAKKIIVMDGICTVDYLKWLRKKMPDAKIIFWYWNIVANSIDPVSIPDTLAEKWSFSRKDCVAYGMRFNPLPYFSELRRPVQDKKQYDVVFVGKDKGRLPELLKLKDAFEKRGLTTKFVISPTHSYDKNPAYSNPIGYLESVELDQRARAVLDYIEVKDSGQSIRVVEALFMQEKIITNSELIYDYDFYCPENIFVLGHDSLDTLKGFLAVPYKPVPEEIIMKYDFVSTIERFFNNERTGFDDMLDRMREKESFHDKEN